MGFDHALHGHRQALEVAPNSGPTLGACSQWDSDTSGDRSASVSPRLGDQWRFRLRMCRVVIRTIPATRPPAMPSEQRGLCRTPPATRALSQFVAVGRETPHRSTTFEIRQYGCSKRTASRSRSTERVKKHARNLHVEFSCQRLCNSESRECHRSPNTRTVRDVLGQNCQRCLETSHTSDMLCP
ncbi:MAG: hypothetical protein QOE16_213 [Microbacteriaceae bacterium]|nr:hypothetical protein [Microbacteriaceae bacterium]